METKSGLSSSRARRRASSPQGNHSTGIVGVLAEIRAGLVGQAVHSTMLGRRFPRAAAHRRCRARLGRWSSNSTGKTALITGGSRGIGLAMAGRFAEAGANVMITSRTAEDLAEAAAGLVAGGATEDQVAWVAAHVGTPEDAQACVAATMARFGGLDILVNNAGDQPLLRPHDRHRLVAGAEDVRGQPAVGAGRGRAAARRRRGCAGSVINVASIGGLGVEPGIGWYNVTKAAVLHITRQLAFELGARRPRQRAGARAW